MTDDETDAGLMRLVRKYGDIKKKIVCVHERLHELTGGAEGAAMSLRNMKFGDYEKTKIAFDAVEWAGISNNLGKLVELVRERSRIESGLSDADLGHLIQ